MNNSLQKKPQFTLHREVSGSPVTADSTDLSTFATRAALNCAGWESVEGYIKLTGGSSPSVVLQAIEVIERPGESDVYTTFQDMGTLYDGGTFSLPANSARVFFRIDTASGSPTKVEIFVAGEKRERGRQ